MSILQLGKLLLRPKMFNMKIANSTKPAFRDGAIHTAAVTMVSDSLLPIVPVPLEVESATYQQDSANARFILPS